MRSSNDWARLVASVLLTAMALAGACGSPGRRPIGSACDNDAGCDSGLCGEGQCLDPASDDDGDSLTNGLEVRLGSSPLEADSDGDQLADGDEFNSADLSNLDTDADGLADIIESATRDADGDCIPDQFDAENPVPNSDLSPMRDVVCSDKGLCAGARARLGVACPDGVAVCIYGGLAGYANPEATCDGIDENCDGVPDDGFADRDHDLIADCVDTDWDNDAALDASDNCPGRANADQVDGDGDGIGDACADAFRLVFGGQPSDVTADATFAAPILGGVEPLEARADSPPAPAFHGRVTLAIEGVAGAVLLGTTAVDAVEGVATFGDLRVHGSGTALIFVASSGTLGVARSEPFDGVQRPRAESRSSAWRRAPRPGESKGSTSWWSTRRTAWRPT